MPRKIEMKIPGSMQARLGLIFLILTAAVTSLFTLYWLWVLEPRLEDDARTQANVMAHSHAWLLADALNSTSEPINKLGLAMDEILVLTNPNTGEPFIEGLSIELDPTLTDIPDDTPLVRGDMRCRHCFSSDIPLYAIQSGELLGVATFQSDSRFFEQLLNDVRIRLYLTMSILVLLLSAAWWIIHSLLVRSQRSDAILSQTFDAMSVPVIAASTDLSRIIHSNQSARDSFADTLTSPGTSVQGIFHDHYDFQVLQQAVRMGQDVNGYECELSDHNGAPYWALISATRVNFHTRAAVILSITDITSLKYAESVIRSSEERFATVVDSIDDLVYVADMHSHELLFMNKAAKRLFGNSKGKKCWEVLYKDQSEPCKPCTNDRILDRHGNPSGIYNWSFHNAMTNQWFRCSDRAIRWVDGRMVRLETATDISELKQAQLELEKARDGAEAASRAKSNFLATMSHEIRTPLNGIIGMGKLLMRSSPRPDQLEYIDAINLSSEQLLLLINDILDISKIEAGKLQLETQDFSLDQLVNETIMLFELRAREKGLALTKRIAPDTPLWLHGDATRLRQILLNLISNAIKFTAEGSVRIEVAGRELPGRRAELSLSVIDTGVGIPAERAEQIFDEFTQLDVGTARRYEGTGLGLAISRRLANAMGGQLRLSDTGTGGSTFSVKLELPLAEQDKESCLATLGHDTPLPPLHILLVEDNLINSKVAQSLLEQEGHTVTTASNGAEGLERLQEEEFELVLMDLHMPVMDGIEATRAIRRLPEQHKRGIPIIALTANIMQEERNRCLDAGMDNFIAKPFTPEKLQQVMCQTLNQVQQHSGG